MIRALLRVAFAVGMLTIGPASISLSSPVPGRIAFVGLVPPDTTAYVYVTDVDGLKLSRLAPAHCCGRLTLSRDGRSMAWGTSRTGATSPSHVMVLTIATSTTAVIAGPPGEVESLAFGDGGRRLALVLRSSRDPQVSDIYTVGVDGRRLKRVVGRAYGVRSVAYSEDGRRIAFDAVPGRLASRQQIFMVHDDGTQLVRVTPPTMTGAAPAFDLDGRRIAFESDGGIFLMNTDGSRVTRLTKLAGLGGGDFQPTFSLDGRYVAFMSATRELPPVGGPQIYVVRVDGTDIKRVTGASYAKFPTFIP